MFIICSYDPPGNWVGERPYWSSRKCRWILVAVATNLEKENSIMRWWSHFSKRPVPSSTTTLSINDFLHVESVCELESAFSWRKGACIDEFNSRMKQLLFRSRTIHSSRVSQSSISQNCSRKLWESLLRWFRYGHCQATLDDRALSSSIVLSPAALCKLNAKQSPGTGVKPCQAQNHTITSIGRTNQYWLMTLPG